MKVHLIKKQSIVDFIYINQRSRTSFMKWISILKMADWNDPDDIKMTFRSADFLGNGSDRIVFNIGGKTFRMICKYYFGKSRVHLFVKWIGNHPDYSKLCNDRKQFDINIY